MSRIGVAFVTAATALVAAVPIAHADEDSDFLGCLANHDVTYKDKGGTLKLSRDIQQDLRQLAPEAEVFHLEQNGLTDAVAQVDVECVQASLGSNTPHADPATPCTAWGCTPNVTYNAVPSGPCVPKSRYDFGVDSVGNAFVCLSIGSWTAAPPLVGVRATGSRCSGQLSAQSPDGIAMLCMNGAWTMGDDIPR